MNNEDYLRNTINKLTFECLAVANGDCEALIDRTKAELLRAMDEHGWQIEALRRCTECKLRFVLRDSTADATGDRLWSEMLEAGFSSALTELDMLFYRLLYLKERNRLTDQEVPKARYLQLLGGLDSVRQSESLAHYRKALESVTKA